MLNRSNFAIKKKMQFATKKMLRAGESEDVMIVLPFCNIVIAVFHNVAQIDTIVLLHR